MATAEPPTRDVRMSRKLAVVIQKQAPRTPAALRMAAKKQKKTAERRQAGRASLVSAVPREAVAVEASCVNLARPADVCDATCVRTSAEITTLRAQFVIDSKTPTAPLLLAMHFVICRGSLPSLVSRMRKQDTYSGCR